MNKVQHTPLIMAAPNGATLQKADHPSVPINSEELVAEAIALQNVGVDLMHLHIRDHQGHHSLNSDQYKRTIDLIMDAVDPGFLVQITTEAVGKYTKYQQMDCVRTVRPKSASLALKELCPTDDDIPEFAAFIAEITEQGCWPHYILYDQTDVQRFMQMKQNGILGTPNPFALFVLGRYTENRTGQPSDLDVFLNTAYAHMSDHQISDHQVSGHQISGQQILAGTADSSQVSNKIASQPELGFHPNLDFSEKLDFPTELDFPKKLDFPWAICCFGPHEAAAAAYAVSKGGHIRIGFENNMTLPDGSIAPNNAALIKATLEEIHLFHSH